MQINTVLNSATPFLLADSLSIAAERSETFAGVFPCTVRIMAGLMEKLSSFVELDGVESHFFPRLLSWFKRQDGGPKLSQSDKEAAKAFIDLLIPMYDSDGESNKSEMECPENFHKEMATPEGICCLDRLVGYSFESKEELVSAEVPATCRIEKENFGFSGQSLVGRKMPCRSEQLP